MASHKFDFVPRRRLTPQQRKRLLARYHRGNLGQSAFAARHGVGLSTLGKWLQQERLTGQPSVGFEEVMLPNTPASATGSLCIRTDRFSVTSWGFSGAYRMI